MNPQIEPYYRETWSIVYVTQASFDYLLEKNLVTPAKKWSRQVKLPDARYLGYDEVRCLAYALASEDFIEKRITLEKSLADALETIEKLQELLSPPEPLYRVKRYIPHTEKTFREYGKQFKLKGKQREVYNIYRSGLKIHQGSAAVLIPWDELFITATTVEGEPFGQLVSDVINTVPHTPAPSEPEPNFL
jgi:hypothetical protein